MRSLVGGLDLLVDEPLGHFPHPAGRLKAAHDWVADRIAYDAPAYAVHKYPPQDAETVFARRVGVCAGYAELLAALGPLRAIREDAGGLAESLSFP